MNLDLLYAELFEPLKKNTLDELNTLLDSALFPTRAQAEIKHQGTVLEEELKVIDVNDEVIEKELLGGSCPTDAEIEPCITNAQKNGGLRECFVKLLRLPDNSDANTPLEFCEGENVKVTIRKSSKKNKEVKQYTCGICKYSTTVKVRIRDHMPIHNKNRSYFFCDVCNTRCAHKHSLQKHMREIHENVEKLSCRYCKFQCDRKADLKNHRKIHTGKNLISCASCNYITTQKSLLKRHLLSHIAVKPFTCYICTRHFQRKRSLPRHMKAVHNK